MARGLSHHEPILAICAPQRPSGVFAEARYLTRRQSTDQATEGPFPPPQCRVRRWLVNLTSSSVASEGSSFAGSWWRCLGLRSRNDHGTGRAQARSRIEEGNPQPQADPERNSERHSTNLSVGETGKGKPYAQTRGSVCEIPTLASASSFPRRRPKDWSRVLRRRALIGLRRRALALWRSRTCGG